MPHVWNHFSHFHEMSFTRAVLLGVQSYSDKDMSPLSDPFLAETSLSLLFHESKIIIVICYCDNQNRIVFSPLPEKYRYLSISLLRKQ